MGISDFIQRKKEMFFVARDADKLELQKQSLMKQREESRQEKTKVEEIRKLQAEISDNRNAIHEARTAGSSGIVKNIGAGFGKFAEGAKKFDKGVQQFSGEPNKDSPFYTGGPSGIKKFKEKNHSKTIHLHFK